MGDVDIESLPSHAVVGKKNNEHSKIQFHATSAAAAVLSVGQHILYNIYVYFNPV